MHPAWIFLSCLGLLAIGSFVLRWPLALALILAAGVGALLAGFWNPLRHLLEGGFGYLNLILALFTGAFFGQVTRLSGGADALADGLHRAVGGNAWAVATTAAALLFSVGMFVGVAGVAVLAVGTFAIPMLRGIGLRDPAIAAFLAVVATAGMIAPPVNVPAMTIADGVNMPFADFAGPLLALSLPVATFAICWYVARRPRNKMAERRAELREGKPGGPLWPGLASLGAVLVFWAALRLFPTVISDPSVPLALVLGGLIALPAVPRARWGDLVGGTFRGVPLELAAILVAVGVGVQIMTLTGIRGWLVINSMSLPQPWSVLGLLGVPVLGGVLTSNGTANVLGVPFAFANIHQDMIVNVSALSAVSALAEFMPPTAIAAVLASYLVGTTSLGQVLLASAVPALVLAVLAVLMLTFSAELAPLLVFRSE